MTAVTHTIAINPRADLRHLEATKKSLESARMDLGHTHHVELASLIDKAIAEADRQIIGASEAINARR